MFLVCPYMVWKLCVWKCHRGKARKVQVRYTGPSDINQIVDSEVRVYPPVHRPHLRWAKAAVRWCGKGYRKIPRCVDNYIRATQRSRAEAMWGHRGGVEYQAIARWSSTQVGNLSPLALIGYWHLHRLSKTIPTEVCDFLKFIKHRTGASFIAFAAYTNEEGEQIYAR